MFGGPIEATFIRRDLAGLQPRLAGIGGIFHGVVMLTPKQITAAIRTLEYAGYTVLAPAAPVGRPMTPARQQVEALAAAGKCRAEIIAETGLSPATVDNALSRWRRANRA